MNVVPVLIVGAGPTGLALACLLARAGIPHRVVDRASGPFPGSRAKGLQPRTLEVLEHLGVGDAIATGSAPFPPFRLYAGVTVKWERTLEEMLSAAPPTGTAHPRARLIPQWRTDRILRERLAADGGRVDGDTELVGLVAEDGGATATLRHGGEVETVRADWVVGCDGAHSAVRKLVGATFPGGALGSEATLIGDVEVDGVDGVACHIYTTDGDPGRRFSLWNLPGTDRFQFVVSGEPAPDAGIPTLDALQRMLEERSGRTDLRLRVLHWASVYQVQVRCVERMRVGRVLLAGDAAHVHSPAGGQGLNTGIQDAYNLGWKLAAVLRGAPLPLLDSFEGERLPVAHATLGLTSSLHGRSFAATGPAPALHQLDLTYRDGPLALDERETLAGLRAGDRAPDALLADGRRLYARFGDWTVLSFAAGSDGERVPVVALPAEVEGWEGCAGHRVLVRPDRHVAAIGREGTASRWLDRWGVSSRR